MSVSVSGGPGSCRGTRTPSNGLLQTQRTGERTDHRQNRYTRPVAGAPTARREMPAVGGDHIGVNIADHRRAADRPTSREGAEDRRRSPSAIRSASPNRLRSSRAEENGSGKGETAVADAADSTRGTSSASTSSTSSAASTATSVSCAPLTANAYSRNHPCQVTLNRPSGASTPRNRGVGETHHVRITEFSNPTRPVTWPAELRPPLIDACYLAAGATFR